METITEPLTQFPSKGQRRQLQVKREERSCGVL